jgi:hypothetical protein
MKARIYPDRPLTSSEKMKRFRENRDRYLRELQLAVSDATWISPGIWARKHAATISRACAAVRKEK